MSRKNWMRACFGSALILAWAAGCGGGSSGPGGGTGGTTDTGGTTSGGTTGTGASNGTGASDGTGASNGTGASSSTGGMGGGMGGATGGDGGAGPDCEVDEDTLDLGLVEASAGGAGGAPGVEGDGPFGWNFATEDEVAAWQVKPEDWGGENEDAALAYGCGTMLVDIEWPEEASESYVSTYFTAFAPSDEQRWNLDGRTLSLDIRWNDGSVPDDVFTGYDVYLSVYSGFGDTYELVSSESGELLDMSEEFTTITFEIPEADGSFDPTIVRSIELRIAAKYWDTEDEEFDYQTAQFEIGSLTW